MGIDDGSGKKRIREALTRIYDEHSPYFKEYLRRYREDPTSRVFAPLAEAYRRLGRLDDAIAICRDGLRYHPDFSGGRVALAKCLNDKGEYGDAKAQLERVTQQYPENIMAQKLMGEIAEKMSDRPVALRAYKMALLLSPNDAALAKKVIDLETEVGEVPISEEEISPLYEEPPKPATASDEEREGTRIFKPSQTATHGEPVSSEDSGSNSSKAPFDPLAESDSSGLFDSEQTQMIATLTQEGEVQLSPVTGETDDLNESYIERMLEQEGTAIDDEPFKVEHVSSIFGEDRQKPEITTETLGDLYFSQGQFEKSLRIFEKLLEGSPTEELRKKISNCREKLGGMQPLSANEKKVRKLKGVLSKIRQSSPH